MCMRATRWIDSNSLDCAREHGDNKQKIYLFRISSFFGINFSVAVSPLPVSAKPKRATIHSVRDTSGQPVLLFRQHSFLSVLRPVLPFYSIAVILSAFLRSECVWALLFFPVWVSCCLRWTRHTKFAFNHFWFVLRWGVPARASEKARCRATPKRGE